MSIINVMLADDHAIVREGIKALLAVQHDIKVIAEAEDGRDAIRQAEKHQPNVIIMDYSMPGLNGLEGTRAILKSAPEVKVIVLTMHDNEEYVLQFIRAGAAGYLLKDNVAEDLISAIRHVVLHAKFYSPNLPLEVIEDYLQQLESGTLKSPLELLTNRQREILQLIAEGMTNRNIAQKLAISIKTVETHRTNIMTKLDIHDQTGLTRFAILHGIISLT